MYIIQWLALLVCHCMHCTDVCCVHVSTEHCTHVLHLPILTCIAMEEINDVVMWPVDALRDGAHRLLGPFSCLTTESHSPLLRGPHTIEDGNTDLPSTSQTLPLKVIPWFSPSALCSCSCTSQALQALLFIAGHHSRPCSACLLILVLLMQVSPS